MKGELVGRFTALALALALFAPAIVAVAADWALRRRR